MTDLSLKCPSCGDLKAYDRSHCVDCLKSVEHRRQITSRRLLDDNYSHAAAYRRLVRMIGEVAIAELLEGRAIVIPEKVNDDRIETATSKHVGRRKDGSILHCTNLIHNIDDIRLDKVSEDENAYAKNSAIDIQIAKAQTANYIIPALKMAWRRFTQAQDIDPYAQMKVAIATYLEFSVRQIQVAGYTDA